VLQVLAASPELSTFYSLLQSTGLDHGVSANGPYSLFVPTNTAFAALSPWELAYYSDPKNLVSLVSLLAYHIVPDAVAMSSLTPNEELLTAEGDPVFVQYNEGTPYLGLSSSTCQKSVSFVGTWVNATNGLVQAINTVMFPQSLVCPNKLFWAESGGLQRVGNLGYQCRSTGFSVLGNASSPFAVNSPYGVALDDSTDQQTLFWTNNNGPQSFLSSVSFDGTALQAILGPVADARGLAAISTANVSGLFFASQSAHAIMTCQYDGTGLSVFWQGAATDFPIDVAIDAHASLIFAAVQTGPRGGNGYLQVSSLSSVAFKVVVPSVPGLQGICLDTVAGHVFMTQQEGTIGCYAYGGSPCPPAISVQGQPSFCAVDNLFASYGGPTKIAYSSPDSGSIHTVDTQSGAEVNIASDMANPSGIQFGCEPRDSYLVPIWKIVGQLFSVAVVEATEALMQAVLPNSAAKLYPWVTVQEDAEISCPAMLLDFPSYTIAQGKTWSQAVSNLTAGAISGGGSAVYAALPPEGPSFLSSSAVLSASNATVSAGTGAGFSMSIQCNGSILFSYGAAVGGGVSAQGTSFQGGAAAVVGSSTVSGGGQCECSGGACTACSGGAAGGSSGNILGLASAVQASAASCPFGQLAVCVSGSGAGGWTNDWCEYSAGFGLNLAAPLIWGFHDHNHNHHQDDNNQGDDDHRPPVAPDQLVCTIDPQGLAINSAINICNSECYDDPNYGSCYCPCFSEFLLANGVSWASEITC